jgi:hypothetical protein
VRGNLVTRKQVFMEVLGLGMTDNKHRHGIVSMCINKIFGQIMKKSVKRQFVLIDMGNVY